MNNDTNNLHKDISNENSTNQHYQEKELQLMQEKQALEEEIKKLQNLVDEKTKLQSYLKADIENIKRNNAKEIEFAVTRGVQKVILNFIAVMDDYERSLEYVKTLKNENLEHGLLITYNAFLKVLTDLGVEQINTTGKFNPEYHEAISSIQAPDKQSEEIIETVQKGFLYKKQLMRAAKVIIAA